MNRRYFVQSSASTVALAAFSKKLVAANDKVTLAMVGVRGQGANLTRNFARLEDVNIAYLCDVDQNVSSLHCHLANIVARTGRNLKFDPKTETIVGDADANRYLGREYRQHWATPKGA